MKIDSLLGGEVLVGSSPPMNIKRDLSIQMHTKHTKRMRAPKIFRYFRCLKILDQHFVNCHEIISCCLLEQATPFFCHAIKFWRDNSVKLMIFLVRFLLRNHRWNWCNFFGNFLHKGISTITPISCTAFGKFPSGRARVREHLSRKSWLVLNWPLSQHCAKNNRRRSVLVSVFSFKVHKKACNRSAHKKAVSKTHLIGWQGVAS